MSTLRISLFGQMQIVYDRQPPAVKISHSARSLLAYLLVAGHSPHSREALAHQFWPDYSESRARNCLSTALWRLRRFLEPEGVPRGAYLTIEDNGCIGFNWHSDHWLDVVVFEEGIRQILIKPIDAATPAEAQALENTLALHSHNLLESFYDDWALRERERLRQCHIKGQIYLMRYYQRHGDCEKSLAYGCRILDEDPLRENIHREVMRLHWQQGHLALAIRQYQICRQILAAELNIAPMTETRVLYHKIVMADRDDAPASEQMPTLQQALLQLEQAHLEFKRVQQKLEQATRLVEQAACRGNQRQMAIS